LENFVSKQVQHPSGDAYMRSQNGNIALARRKMPANPEFSREFKIIWGAFPAAAGSH